MQTRKERGEVGWKDRGREGQRERETERGQADRTQFSPNRAKVQPGSCAGKGNRELLYPQEVIWMSKGQAAKVLSRLANPSQGKEASGT